MKVTHIKTRVLQAPAENLPVKGMPAGSALREYVTLKSLLASRFEAINAPRLALKKAIAGLGKAHTFGHGTQQFGAADSRTDKMTTSERGTLRKWAWRSLLLVAILAVRLDFCADLVLGGCHPVSQTASRCRIENNLRF